MILCTYNFWMCSPETLSVLSLFLGSSSGSRSFPVLIHLIFMLSLHMSKKCIGVDKLWTDFACHLVAYLRFCTWTSAWLLMTNFIGDIFVAPVAMPAFVQMVLNLVFNPSFAPWTFVFACSYGFPFFIFSSCLIVRFVWLRLGFRLLLVFGRRLLFINGLLWLCLK